MLTLKDILSHLTYVKACKLLGPQGEKLIWAGGKYDIDLTDQVRLNNSIFRVDFGGTSVSIQLDDGEDHRLNISCSSCTTSCEHQGAAFSLILEEKLALGLAAPPPEKVPVESLSDEELVQNAIQERAERAMTQKMRINSVSPKELWTDYTVVNRASGKT